ncbi:hypothetical protein [Streptomyces sp. NPDC057002]|uniref:hypothetical protein n=1 Tax=Streptomyces sp. NPDC057002 TaxID=3345992 RepID=UPI003624EBDB
METVKASDALGLAQREERAGRSGVVLFGGRGTRKAPLKNPVRVTVEQATDAKGVLLLKGEDGKLVDRVKTGTEVYVVPAPPEFVKIRSLAELLALSRAGVPVGAHDADEDGVTFEWVDGRAAGHGFWPEKEAGKEPYGSILEAHILVKQHGVEVAAVNAAWLMNAALDAAVAEEDKQKGETA